MKSLDLSGLKEMPMCLVALSAALRRMLMADAVQGPVWLWRLNPTGGVAASSGFSFSVVARGPGPGLSEAASGCLAVCPAERNPFHGALGQPFPMMSTDLSPWL